MTGSSALAPRTGPQRAEVGISGLICILLVPVGRAGLRGLRPCSMMCESPSLAVLCLSSPMLLALLLQLGPKPFRPPPSRFPISRSSETRATRRSRYHQTALPKELKRNACEVLGGIMDDMFMIDSTISRTGKRRGLKGVQCALLSKVVEL